jgi:hypothetical protein
MSDDRWFSATLRLFIVNSVVGKLRAEEGVFLVRADDFDDAFSKFLRLGELREENYKNHLGEEIKRRFAEITTLDLVGESNLDGAEITSSACDEPDPSVTLGTQLNPSRSKPTQTI